MILNNQLYEGHRSHFVVVGSEAPVPIVLAVFALINPEKITASYLERHSISDQGDRSTTWVGAWLTDTDLVYALTHRSGLADWDMAEPLNDAHYDKLTAWRRPRASVQEVSILDVAAWSGDSGYEARLRYEVTFDGGRSFQFPLTTKGYSAREPSERAEELVHHLRGGADNSGSPPG